MHRNRQFWLLLLILLLAAITRIYHINLQSIWIDEGFTWNLTQYDDPLLILRRDVHPPLYFLAIRVWVGLAGTSVVAMRFFSALPSMVSIAVAYQLAWEIERQRGVTSGGMVPVLAALLLALCDAENYLAQETRSYTWQVLFASLSMWGFLRWGRTGGRRWLALWMVNTIALIYTFYLGAFVGVAQGVYALVFLNDKSSEWAQFIAPLRLVGRKRLQALGVLMLCALALAPWLAYTLGEQSGNLSHAEWIELDAFSFWLRDFRLRYFSQQWALMLGLLVFGLVIVRYEEGCVRLRWHPTTILLLLWLTVPLLLTLIANLYAPLYQPHRVSQIVPAIALLTAFGIGNLPHDGRWFVVIVVVVYGVIHTDFWRVKQPWRDMVRDTAPYIAPGVPILLELGGDEYAPRYHYAEGLPNSYDFLLDRPATPAPDANVLIGLTTWRHLETESYEAGLPPLIDSLDHLWLFYWSSDTGALHWLDTFGHQRTATFTVDFNPDVYFYRYDRLPQAPLMHFDNGMVLQSAQVYDNLLVELLWTTDRPLDIDYTVSAFLLDEGGQLVAQFDSQPFLNQRPTTGWTTDEAIFDPRRLQVVNGSALPDGAYQAGVVIYRWQDGQIVHVQTTAGSDHFIFGQVDMPGN